MKYGKLFFIAAFAGLLLSCSKGEPDPVPVTEPDPVTPMPVVDSELWEEVSQALVRTDVLNEAYYKDVFMDGGIRLTSRTTLPACKAHNLSLEYFTAEPDIPADSLLQTALFAGSEIDRNGALLFPDGEPRFKVFYSNGGKSSLHGESLMAPGRNAVRSFYYAGGSYVGSCAGAFLASAKRGNNYQPQYYGIWPGSATESGLSDSSTGMFVDEGSPLLDYFDYGGDHYIADVRHNGGCYYEDTMTGTEILARYDREDMSMHNRTSIWAWKISPWYGRIICCGSHPEGITSGEQLDLMSAMLLYAIDGRGAAKVKSVLSNGGQYVSPVGIGDGQCHHFVAAIPPQARNIRVRLSYSGDYDIRLLMKKGTFAFESVAEHKDVSSSSAKTLEFETLAPGAWYIGVYNTSRPEVSDTGHGLCDYTGRTELLNGIDYVISVNWEE